MKRRHRNRHRPTTTSSGPREAFLPDPGDGPARTTEDLAEELAEEFVASATSNGDPEGAMQNEIDPAEVGGPFVETSANEELARGTDASNPKDAEPAPWPRTLGES